MIVSVLPTERLRGLIDFDSSSLTEVQLALYLVHEAVSFYVVFVGDGGGDVGVVSLVLLMLSVIITVIVLAVLKVFLFLLVAILPAVLLMAFCVLASVNMVLEVQATMMMMTK